VHGFTWSGLSPSDCWSSFWHGCAAWFSQTVDQRAAPLPIHVTNINKNIGTPAVELKPDDLREIKSAISKITVQGDRYPENLKKMTGR
jgi:hypothetical protein